MRQYCKSSRKITLLQLQSFKQAVNSGPDPALAGLIQGQNTVFKKTQTRSFIAPKRLL